MFESLSAADQDLVKISLGLLALAQLVYAYFLLSAVLRCASALERLSKPAEKPAAEAGPGV